MDTTKRIFSIVKASGAFLGTILVTLVAPNDTDSNDRSQGDGSNLFGEHNFRTGQPDSGADPDGWYEEDM